MTERPDAAPPKEVPKEIFLQVEEEDDGTDLGGTTWCADQINETDIRYVLAPPPSEAAPVAQFIDWLSEDWVTTICSEYDGAGDKEWVEEGAVRRVKDMLRKAHEDFIAVHPEDATTNEREVVGSSAPGGPWRSENIGDEDRSWGPTVWDSRVDRALLNLGTSRFHFDTLPLAEAVRDVLNRDALNRVDRLKGDET